MNPYFMVFALYALIISPVTLHASVRIGRGVRYRILLQFSGLPVINRSFDGERQREKRVKDRDVAGALKPDTFRAAKAIAHSQAVRHLPRLFRWEGLHVRVRLSFDDAAATAMSFAGLHAVANVARALAPNAPLTGRVEADFQGRGSELYARCIVSARLGSLGYAAIVLASILMEARERRSPTEERSYAASH